MSLDTSGTSTAGTVGIPPSRFAGAYYQFTDPTQVGDLTVVGLGKTLLTKNAAANSDGVQSIKPTDMDVTGGDLVVHVASVTNGNAGDKLNVTLFLDY